MSNGYSKLRSVRAGRERVTDSAPRHRHLEAYALIVVDGVFEQAGFGGRATVQRGDLLLQPTLDCHLNRLLTSEVEVLRLPWRLVGGLGGHYRLNDLDALVRTAERDIHEASAMAQADVLGKTPVHETSDDWPDALAADISSNRVAVLAEWAEQKGLAAETVSRGFVRLYGVTPARFRLELKVRRAWLRIVAEGKTLAEIAAETGFADQGHMTRCVREVTGATPRDWRATITAQERWPMGH